MTHLRVAAARPSSDCDDGPTIGLTVSSLTVAPIHAAIAGMFGLDRVKVLTMQSASGAMGHMVCTYKMLAVGAVLGLRQKWETHRGPDGVASVLRLTFGPLLVHALIAAAMTGVFSVAYS